LERQVLCVAESQAVSGWAAGAFQADVMRKISTLARVLATGALPLASFGPAAAFGASLSGIHIRAPWSAIGKL
jgi:hypothetical protein